jgi:hypothetical protein
MTVSVWWVLWAFLGGAWAGILAMALLFIAAADRREPSFRRSSDAPEPQRVIAEPL